MYPLNWKYTDFMIHTRLKGMGVALITPFKEDDSVDYDALLRLVDYQLQNGTDFLCVLGTTAETPTLTSEEKPTLRSVSTMEYGSPALGCCVGYALSSTKR